MAEDLTQQLWKDITDGACFSLQSDESTDGMCVCFLTFSPVLSVEPNSPQIFRGETVTLTCRISGWSGPYYWNKDGGYSHRSAENYYTIKVDQSHRYRCYGSTYGWSTPWSKEVTLSVIERPKAVLTLQPDGQIFSGQEVTFTCEIRGHADTEWMYNWYKDGVQIFSYTESRKYSFTAVESLSAKYTCSGRRRSDSQTSETSNTVTLTVSEKPKPTVRVNPQSSVYTGDRVTLNCNLLSNGWTFLWYKDGVQVAEDTNTLHDTVSNAGETVYQCKARRGNYDSELSDPVTVTVRGESPPVSLIINPSRTQHFTADSLSLSCEDQSDSTGWTVRGYTHSETVSDCSSVSGSTCNISSLSTSHTGVYWCQSESGGRSNPVNITVHHGHVILDSPVHPVTEGHPLTLHCLSRNSKTSASGVDFYKDGSVLQNKTTGEMTISTVSKSDEGFYHCKHPERGESPKSWVSVRNSGSGSSIDIVFVAVGLSLALLFIILLLILRWWHKSIKGKDRDIQQNSNQTPGQNPSQSGAEDSQSGHTPLQTDVHIYATVENASKREISLFHVKYFHLH
ncbi:carcinoembryonic antigen-related cell adhesion molecule 5-like [Ictalurus furcatus]|uniref:carcinoembryonic antigen-related cell adhesion molecule 5-like n=1 Tax=Ictalurus furcatus TaxID=66913 RepID=UPI002350039A|nr:carcinoembryonic antigen-related cell adhesion molecule 5-like [Ictalurus furcatus]